MALRGPGGWEPPGRLEPCPRAQGHPAGTGSWILQPRPHLAAFTSVSDRGSHVFACSLGARQWAEPLCTGVLLTASLEVKLLGRGGARRGGLRVDVGSLSLPVHLLFLWPLGSPSQPSLGTQPYSQWSSHLAKVWCWPLCWRGILNSPAHLPPGPECSPCPSPSPWASLWALLHIPGAPSQASSRLCTCCSPAS